MLTETEELEVAWHALSGQITRSEGNLTVALAAGGGRFRAGIAYPSGEQMLLVGFNLVTLPKQADLPEGGGFRVNISSEALASGYCNWVCLTRQDGAREDFFALMASDVMSALRTGRERTEAGWLASMLSRIRAWQEFMQRPAKGVLSPGEEVGLAGELMVLRQLVKMGVPPCKAVASWVGPARGLQDFQTGEVGLEVKSTLQPAGFPVRISSLEQLDEAAGRRVMLAGLRLCLQKAGSTLPELVNAVRVAAGDHADVLSVLERSLLLAGYSDDVATKYERRFDCAEIRLYVMEESFPRLIRSAISPAIRAASYDLDLDLVPCAPLNFDAVLPAFGINS